MDRRLDLLSHTIVSRRSFLSGGLGLAACGAFGASRVARAATRVGPPEWLAEARAIESALRLPSIVHRERRLGPLEGDARPVIQGAIEDLSRLGGGRVALASGAWRIDGPLRLLSGVELHLERGAEVVFSGDPKRYLPAVVTRWEGTELFGYSPYIYAYHATNIAITGEGTLSVDMSGDVRSWRREQEAAQRKLRQQGGAGEPLHRRVFEEGAFLRPSFVQFFGCYSARIEGVSIRSVPFWCVHLVYSHHVVVRGVTVESREVNNDGVDIDSSTNVLVEGCRFRTGDDCVAIKSGRDLDGRGIGAPSERVVIRDCVMERSRSAGIAIGSEMSGGIRQVYILRCRMGTVDTVLNVKSNLDRGGVVERIRLWNVSAERSEQVAQITTAYHGYAGGQHPPLFRDISIDDLRCDRAESGVVIRGVRASPVEQVTLRDVVIGSVKKPRSIEHATGLTWDGVVMNGQPIG